jgi:N-acetyl-anhydromuramyl-L-alanine amidase AmpD
MNKFCDIISEVYETPDFRPKRERRFSAIVIHHTGNVAKDDNPDAWERIASSVLNWLTKADTNYVSAHFQINRDGKILQLCDPRFFEAFHAGKSEHWHHTLRQVVSDWNRYAVGIELVGDGNAVAFTPEQYQSLIKLTEKLMTAFLIHPRNILGHEEISPGRKQDPGYLFDWANYLREVYTLNS